MLKNKKGFTLIELVIVIALIGVIGTIVFTLVGAGRNQLRITNENFDAQSEARIAMAYITTTLRQNDTSGGITVSETKTELTINNSSGMPYIGFYLGGKNLMVKNIMTKEDPKEIAKINSINFSQVEKSVSITIGYGNNKELKSTITLRSE